MMWTINAVESFKLKYDVRLPARIIYVLAHMPKSIIYVANYEVMYLLPEDMILATALWGIEDHVQLKKELASKIEELDKKINASQQNTLAGNLVDNARTILSIKLKKQMKVSPVIDNVIVSSEERSLFKTQWSRHYLELRPQLESHLFMMY